MKKRKWVMIAVAGMLICAAAGAGISYAALRGTRGSNYTIPQIDLSVMPEDTAADLAYLYDSAVVDDSADYLAHPDAVLLNNGTILTVYPQGHGKGAIRTRLSSNGGLSYAGELEATPASWETSEETPTIYRLSFAESGRTDKLILISANPKWGAGYDTTGGFNCSVSDDEGRTWSEFALFYPKDEKGGVVPIVAMASLTRLKENGVFADKWMGLFHDSSFRNYKSILTFDENGEMQWSTPERYLADYRSIEKKAMICEVEVIRSDGGKGDELCLLTRSNSKRYNSLVSFSRDEGETWSEPQELPAALSGERHKAEYTPDGRLVVTFRSIERSPEKLKQYGQSRWYSEGWVAWVGTYEDIREGREGQYRVKLAHTYLPGQTQPQTVANADTGYCGNVVFPDGTVVLSSYGCFSSEAVLPDGGLRTYILSKRLRLEDLDRLAGQ